MRVDYLVPLPVVLPLMMAAFLAAMKKFMPRRLADALAWLTALAVGLISGVLIHVTVSAPIVYWFGGWTPRSGVALGISFVASPMGAGLAAFVSLLVAAALMFSWRYFDTIGTLFHVLMLVFLAAMCGFALTGDLFNLFVWFELMSASAFALCGYKIEESGPLQGALNFAITNTIGAFLVLWGIAMLYARTGALNMAQIGRALGGHTDGLIITAFVLIMAGFFVKGAVFPFHFWLADAHAVAPTPVCVLFSGIMVELGIYAVARVYWSIMDAPFHTGRPALRGLLLAVGIATALLGAVMCFGQRHIKRLLAFSTISHVGLLVIGLGLLDPTAVGGAALYVVGHGCVKGALFLCSGIILHRLGSVDELELWDRARNLHGTAILWIIAGLGLAGMPGFATFIGETGIEDAAKKFGHDWLGWIFFISGVLTAGAVFRVAGRIFFGYGGHKKDAITGAQHIPEGRETKGSHRRIPLSMVAPAVALVVVAIAIGLNGSRISHAANFAAAEMADSAGYQARVLEGAAIFVNTPVEHNPVAPAMYRGFAAVGAAVLLAWLSLWQGGIKQMRDSVLGSVYAPLRAVHSGHIGDFVTFLTFGVAAFGAVLAALIHFSGK